MTPPIPLGPLPTSSVSSLDGPVGNPSHHLANLPIRRQLLQHKSRYFPVSFLHKPNAFTAQASPQDDSLFALGLRLDILSENLESHRHNLLADRRKRKTTKKELKHLRSKLDARKESWKRGESELHRMVEEVKDSEGLHGDWKGSVNALRFERLAEMERKGKGIESRKTSSEESYGIGERLWVVRRGIRDIGGSL